MHFTVIEMGEIGEGDRNVGFVRFTVISYSTHLQIEISSFPSDCI